MDYKKIFAEHILNTPPESEIILLDVLISSLPIDLYKELRLIEKFSSQNIYISTKSLKHAYDRRQEFTASSLDNLPETFITPDYVVKGREDQRADFIFLKWISRDRLIACPVEICEQNDETALFCITFFPARISYIKKSTILWSREDGGISPS